MSLFSIFNKQSKSDLIREYQQKGAKVLDVRTAGEYSSGHHKSSVNIPLQDVQNRLAEIKKWECPVIAVCASGMRSGSATALLKKNGVDCINGGGWSMASHVLNEKS